MTVRLVAHASGVEEDVAGRAGAGRCQSVTAADAEDGVASTRSAGLVSVALAVQRPIMLQVGWRAAAMTPVTDAVLVVGQHQLSVWARPERNGS